MVIAQQDNVSTNEIKERCEALDMVQEKAIVSCLQSLDWTTELSLKLRANLSHMSVDMLRVKGILS